MLFAAGWDYDRVSQPMRERATRNAHQPLAPMTPVLAMLTGILVRSCPSSYSPASLSPRPGVADMIRAACLNSKS